MKNEYETKILNLEGLLRKQEILKSQMAEKIARQETLLKKEKIDYIFRLEEELEKTQEKVQFMSQQNNDLTQQLGAYKRGFARRKSEIPKNLNLQLGLHSFQNSMANSTNVSQLSSEEKQEKRRTHQFKVEPEGIENHFEGNKVSGSSQTRPKLEGQKYLDLVNQFELQIEERDGKIRELEEKVQNAEKRKEHY